jgi:hypothetical protein
MRSQCVRCLLDDALVVALPANICSRALFFPNLGLGSWSRSRYFLYGLVDGDQYEFADKFNVEVGLNC